MRAGRKLVRINVPRNNPMSPIYLIGSFTKRPWKDSVPLVYSTKLREFAVECWLKPGDMFLLKVRKQVFLHSSFHKTTVPDIQNEDNREVNIFCHEDGQIEELKALLGLTIMFCPRRMKFRSGTHFIKKSKKIYEDRFFAGDLAIGIADGVSSWRELEIDSGKFAEAFMNLCRANMHDISSESSTACNSPRYSPGFSSLKSVAKSAFNELTVPGSSTFLIAALVGEKLKICNLGDSSLIVVRFEDEEPRILLQTKAQQFTFNTPYQIGCYPLQHKRWGQIEELADEYEVQVEAGDLVITSTDGLWDNVYISDILSIVKRSKEDPILLAKSLSYHAYTKSKSQDRTPFQDAVEAEYGLGEWKGGKPDDITVIVSMIAME